MINNIKSEVKIINKLNSEDKIKAIIQILRNLRLEYNLLKSNNGYIIIEIYEVGFIIEAGKKLKWVKIK